MPGLATILLPSESIQDKQVITAVLDSHSFVFCFISMYRHMQVKATGKEFVYLNTHLDDQSDDERILGASLILWRARFEASQNRTVLVTGDFNR